MTLTVKSSPRCLSAMALACLLIAAQVQAQSPAAGQGAAVAGQGSSVARPASKAKASNKASAKAKAKDSVKAKPRAKVDRSAAAAATAALAAGGVAAASAAPQPQRESTGDVMPLPRVVGDLPAGSRVDSRVRGNDVRTGGNDGQFRGNDVRLPAGALTAQGGLSLQYILDAAVQAHPSLQSARLEMRAAGEDQTAVKRQRLPSVSAVLENRSTNTSVISTRVLRVEQTLWDAGRISARIREAESNIDVNQARIYITAQQLGVQIINAWQNLMAADGRIRVARETLDRLQAYREQMQRRVQAEASPPIDLELVNSRMLQTEVELTQAQNSRRVALSRLEQFSGLEGLTSMANLAPVSPPGIGPTEAQAQWLQQVDWLEVASRHPNVQKARQDAIAAQHRIDAKKAEQYPQVYLRVDQPINAANNDITGFVGLRYTPGAGLATAVEAQALASRAASLEQAVDTAVREVTENLFTDRDEFNSSRSRLLALERAVKGSESVLESYTRQFTASRKSWLDLMNAVRELAQNQYAMADSHAAMMAALYRLQVRMGDPVQPAP